MYRTENNTMAETISASVQGAEHIQNDKTCQDAISIKEGSFHGSPYLICSVADGHGGDDYHFSHIGSLFATSAAEKTATQFLQSGATTSDSRGEYFSNHVIWHLKDEWEENIKQSWEQFRVTYDHVRRHGTTILSVLIYQGYAYMAQLGDGDICYLDREENPVFLVQPDEGPTDSTTDSLCSRRANNYWNFACIPLKDITFLMMSTDGLINSMSTSEEYVKLIKTLQGYVSRFRPSEINALLPEWLSDYSENGCGDDISLVGINLKTNNKLGEMKNDNTENTRTEDHEKTSGGRTRGSVCRRKKRTIFSTKVLQRIKRHPGTKSYYLLSGAGRRTRRRVC